MPGKSTATPRCAAIVGLDTLAHLTENARMATGFQPMDAQARARISNLVRLALAGHSAPWDRAGYDDQIHSWA